MKFGMMTIMGGKKFGDQTFPITAYYIVGADNNEAVLFNN